MKISIYNSMSNFLPSNYQNFTFLRIKLQVVDQGIKLQVLFILYNPNKFDVHLHYISQLISVHRHDNAIVNFPWLRPAKNVILQIFMSFGQTETSSSKLLYHVFSKYTRTTKNPVNSTNTIKCCLK